MSSDERVVCVECGAVNKVPGARKASAAHCGRCGVHLFTGKPADVDGSMYHRQITKGTLPVLVDVWAPWCGPCKAMAPEFEKAAAATEPRLRFIKLNSDVEQATAAKLAVRGIPTTLLYRRGKELARVSGAMSASQINAWVDQQLEANPA